MSYMKSLKDFINETILSRKLSDPKKLQIEEWLRSRDIKNYKIKNDYNIDVDGDVKLLCIKEIPNYIQFNIVDGDFICSNSSLKSLKGCPIVVRGHFDCSYNNLTSLEGAPEKVDGSFDCTSNNISSFKGCPDEIRESFYCSYNKLTSLKDFPRIIGSDFYCDHNNLTSLEGAPKVISGSFNCTFNKLTTLLKGPKIVKGSFQCSHNLLTSLEGAPKVVEGDFFCSSCSELASLDGAPKEVGGNFYCDNHGKRKFTEDDIRSACNVKKKVKIYNIYNNFSYKSVFRESLKNTINETILSRKLSDPKRLVIEEWLKEYGIKNYTIKDNYEIDVNGDVNLHNKDIKEFPEYIQFGTVKGLFDCSLNYLTSLKRAPKYVGGEFDCSFNRLTSLEGSPKKVGGSFSCTGSNLISLRGCPRVVKKGFFCNDNKLKSLDGAPKEVGGVFYCSFNTTKFTIDDVKKVSKVKGEIIT